MFFGVNTYYNLEEKTMRKGGFSEMKKCGRTALSLLLSASMGVATVTPVTASPARGEPNLNPLVAVI